MGSGAARQRLPAAGAPRVFGPRASGLAAARRPGLLQESSRVFAAPDPQPGVPRALPAVGPALPPLTRAFRPSAPYPDLPAFSCPARRCTRVIPELLCLPTPPRVLGPSLGAGLAVRKPAVRPRAPEPDLQAVAGHRGPKPAGSRQGTSCKSSASQGCQRQLTAAAVPSSVHRELCVGGLSRTQAWKMFLPPSHTSKEFLPLATMADFEALFFERLLRDLGITGPPGEHLPYWDQIPYTRFLFDFW